MKLRFKERVNATSRTPRFEPRRIISNAIKARRLLVAQEKNMEEGKLDFSQ